MPNPVDESTSITDRAPTPTFTAITDLSDGADDQSWSRADRPARLHAATQAELVQRYTPNIEMAVHLV
jgi:hypothetical protein